MDLCERATWRPGVRVSWLWWEQAIIDLEGAKKRAAESTTRSETESEEDLDGESNGDARGEEKSQGVGGSSEEEWSWAEDG